MDQLIYDLLIILLIILNDLIVVHFFNEFSSEFMLFFVGGLYGFNRVIVNVILFEKVFSLFFGCLSLSVLFSVLLAIGGLCLICSLCRSWARRS